MKKNLLLLYALLLGSAALYAQDIQTIESARAAGVPSVVTVKGVVTTDNVFDSRLRYFQDETAGIVVYQAATVKGFDISQSEIGDTIQVTGQLGEFNNLLQISIPDNPDVANVTLVYDRSEDVNPTSLPQPKTVVAKDLGENLEGQLLRFADATVNTTDRLFSFGNYTILDSTSNDDNDFQMRLGNNSHPLIGTPIPTGTIEIIGVLGEFRGTYQLLPRDEEDLIAGLAIENYTQVKQNLYSLGVNFATTLPAGGILRYKRYDRDETAFDTLYLNDGQNKFSVDLLNLEPAQFYNIEIYTSATSDNNKSAALVNILAATKSESSGDIKVLFNYLPEDLPQNITYNPENYSDNFAAEIASLIDNAQLTVDVAIYNVNSGGSAIIEALNRAKERGVQVRYLFQEDNFDYEIGNLNGAIPVQARPEGDGIMHNKFVVVDAGSSLRSYVATGSTNWTSNNLFEDSNDLLIIQDQAIARAFTVEFNEMWGTTSQNTTPAQLRFGSDKVDNVPHLYNVGGRKVQLYFSPTDAINFRITQAIEDTRSDIRFALADITRSDLTDLLIAEAEKGWSVKGLIHADSYTLEGNTVTTDDISARRIQDFYDTNGLVDLVIDTVSGLHHKFVVVNALRPDANPFVLTGSHNWTISADEINDENTLVIYDQEIAEAYLNHWRILYWAASKGGRDQVLTSVENDILNSEVAVYPVPATDNLFIKNNTRGAVEVQIITANGQRVQTLTVTPSAQPEPVSLQHLNAGVYFVRIQSANAVTTKTIILTR